MKRNTESGRRSQLIIGGAALAALVAWLALHEGEKTPVVSESRARIGRVFHPDAGARASLAKILKKTTKEAGDLPPEPLKSGNAIGRAKEGNIEAAKFLADQVGSRVTAILGEGATSEEWEGQLPSVLAQLGITPEEYKTLKGALEILPYIQALENPPGQEGHLFADVMLDVNHKMFLEGLKEIGPFGARDPMLAALLGKDAQSLRDLVQEALQENQKTAVRLPPEDAAILRSWYGLGQDR